MEKRESSKLVKPSGKPFDVLVAFIFLFYFGNGLIRLGYNYVFGSSSIFFVLYNIVFFVCIVLYALMRSRRNLAPALVCLIGIIIIFGVTYLLHPEYKDWFFERTYGIQIQFLRGMGGIWAFWVICMVPDRDELYRYLRWAAWLLFAYCVYRFISAQRRGYWLDYNAQYELIQASYNLGFGYDVMFCSLFFACEAFTNKKPLYYIPYAAGFIMILLEGSRGALIWLVLVFPMMLVYKWKQMRSSQKVGTVLLIIILVPLIFVLYFFYDEILERLNPIFQSSDITSRTLSRLFSGQVSDLSGRDRIWSITWERIKEGGLFGNGAFGERTAVGQYYRWGYAHNIFLEVYCAFGYIGGTVFFAILLTQCVKTAMFCREKRDQIIFLTFAMSSMKLMLSDSFWFNSSFWALLAILVIWRKQDIAAGIRPQPRFRISWD